MKGILFRPEMITAITNGSKTVTRRLDGLMVSGFLGMSL